MPVRIATPQETRDWLGSGRVFLGARPPASSTEKPTGSSESVDPKIRQEMLDAMDRSIEAGFRGQDAYQMELQRQSTTDGSQASPTKIQDSEV
jgi:hypothetical protein